MQLMMLDAKHSDGSCIPLAVETFGNWGREAQCVFSRLAALLPYDKVDLNPQLS